MLNVHRPAHRTLLNAFWCSQSVHWLESPAEPSIWLIVTYYHCTNMSGEINKYNELAYMSRRTIFCMLFVGCRGGVVDSKQIVSVAEAFGCHVSTIRRVWRQTLENMEAHLLAEAVDIIDNEDEEDLLVEKLHLFWTKKLPLALFPYSVFKSKKFGRVGRKRQH